MMIRTTAACSPLSTLKLQAKFVVALVGSMALASDDVTAQQAAPADPGASGASAAPPKPWFERLSLRGYAQVRYNGLLRTNDELACQQCDRSIGGNGGLFIRRARMVLSGDVSERVAIYLQTDFASEVSGALHFAQLRDAYFDLALDAKKVYRVRIGQSKIPYGWENLQSSSNRLALDRADALNSAIANERDIGVFFYWTPPHLRQRLRTLVESGLKGSGDYGIIGAGVFNGQTANRPEANADVHGVVRLSYPFMLRNGQFIEVGLQGYHGRYTLPSGSRSTGLVGPETFDDSRIGASFVVYPQPFGMQAEWNIGRGPEFDPVTQETRTQSLDGGYVQTMYRITTGSQVITPFMRGQRYAGGKKMELDARRYRVREVEVGIEWQPMPAFELTAMYAISDREYEDLANLDNRQRGEMLRLQAQVNY